MNDLTQLSSNSGVGQELQRISLLLEYIYISVNFQLNNGFFLSNNSLVFIKCYFEVFLLYCRLLIVDSRSHNVNMTVLAQ